MNDLCSHVIYEIHSHIAFLRTRWDHQLPIRKNLIISYLQWKFFDLNWIELDIDDYLDNILNKTCEPLPIFNLDLEKDLKLFCQHLNACM